MVLYPPPKYCEYFREHTFPGKKVEEAHLPVLMACLLLARDEAETKRILGLTHFERVAILKGLGFKKERQCNL